MNDAGDVTKENLIDKQADTGQNVLSDSHILSICQTGSGSVMASHKSDNPGDIAASTVSENIRKIDKEDKYPVHGTTLINVSRIAEISDMGDIKSNEAVKREIRAWLKSMQDKNDNANFNHKCPFILPSRGN